MTLRDRIDALLAGAASLRLSWWLPEVDYRPPPRHTVEEALRADAEALAGDWRKVGGDTRRAMERMEAELTPEEREKLVRGRAGRRGR